MKCKPEQAKGAGDEMENKAQDILGNLNDVQSANLILAMLDEVAEEVAQEVVRCYQAGEIICEDNL